MKLAAQILLQSLLLCSLTQCTVYTYNELPLSKFNRVERPKMKFYLLAPQDSSNQKSWRLANCSITGNVLEADMQPMSDEDVLQILGSKSNAGAKNKNSVLLYPGPDFTNNFKENQRSAIFLNQIARIRVSELDHNNSNGKPLFIGIGMLTLLNAINNR